MSTKLNVFKKISTLFGDVKFGYIAIAALFLFLNLYVCYIISNRRLVLGVGLIVIAVLAICYFISKLLLQRRSINAQQVFLVFIIFQGMLYLIIFPPVTVPDEPYHFMNTYRYSNILLLQPFGDSSFLIRNDDIDFIKKLNTYINAAYYDSIIDQFKVFATDPALTEYQYYEFGFDSNLPQVRLAGAFGIALGRLLNLGAVPVFFLGRLFNFALYTALVYFSIKLIPFGKRIIMVTSMLPMSLHLGASYSYDAAIIGMSFLLIALILRALYSVETVSNKSQIAIIVVTALLAPCKAIYALVAFLVFLIPSSKFCSKRRAFCFKGIVCLSIILPIAIFKFAMISGIAGTSFSGSGETTYEIVDMIRNPSLFVTVILNTVNEMSDFYLGGIVGQTLGWFQGSIGAYWYMVFCYLLLLCLATIRIRSNALELSPQHRACFFMVFFLLCLLIIVSMLFAWTPNTGDVVEGVQGRYFLPVLPLALLSFRGSTIIIMKDNTLPLVFASTIFNVAYITKIYAMGLVA